MPICSSRRFRRCRCSLVLRYSRRPGRALPRASARQARCVVRHEGGDRRRRHAAALPAVGGRMAEEHRHGRGDCPSEARRHRGREGLQRRHHRQRRDLQRRFASWRVFRHPAARRPRAPRKAALGRHRLPAARAVSNTGAGRSTPREGNYSRNITFNDGAMIGVMRLLAEVGAGTRAVRVRRRAATRAGTGRGRARAARDSRVAGVVNGTRTVWCAQHDPETLAPAGRQEIRTSVAQRLGERRNRRVPDGPAFAARGRRRRHRGRGRVVPRIQDRRNSYRAAAGGRRAARLGPLRVPDPMAPVLWARFYEIGTNRPIFSGRDSIVKYSLAEIEHERRNGYSWYGEYRRTCWRRSTRRGKGALGTSSRSANTDRGRGSTAALMTRPAHSRPHAGLQLTAPPFSCAGQAYNPIVHEQGSATPAGLNRSAGTCTRATPNDEPPTLGEPCVAAGRWPSCSFPSCWSPPPIVGGPEQVDPGQRRCGRGRP